MARTVDPIKQQKVETAMKRGESAKDALLQAGYTIKTAIRSTANKSVKISQDNIMRELKASDVTIDLVIKNLNEDRELARKKHDISTMSRCDELLGKYLAMFTDKQKVDTTLVTKEEESIVHKYLQSNRLESIS